MHLTHFKTTNQLRKSGYKFTSIKDELRENLIQKLKTNEQIFPGIIGFEETVIPELQNAILSKHDFILLGLRGQAKTKILRLLVNLLDEYIPIIKDCEINDHPYHPICHHCREKIAEHGEDTEIEWIPRQQRYSEKLATPDVSIADLFGDIDPIKAVNKRLHYAHEGAMHFGIIPRTNRGIFVINELPDLQPRIQVGLLNILEEKDLQIRGYPLRIPLDILIAFSANPEDYTNRGRIITPLKDRIDSQIITHYPLNINTGIEITEQEAWQFRNNGSSEIPLYIREIIEHVADEARQSELIDQKSGVSARLAISSLENLISNAERRAFLQKEKNYHIRICDLQSIIPAITGKIELVYEGEQEGLINVAKTLLGKAIKSVFLKYFPVPDQKKSKSSQQSSEYDNILNWFSGQKIVTIDQQCSDSEYIKSLEAVTSLDTIVKKYFHSETNNSKIELAIAKEFVLEGLHQYAFLSKHESNGKFTYKDLMETIFNSMPEDDENEYDFNS
ncbi:magnesium chelatase [Calditrichota bacterium]